MTQDQDNDSLWKELTRLDEASDVQGALEFASRTPLSGFPRGQRYIAWAYSQLGDSAEATSWYLKAARKGDAEAIDDCYKWARWLEANGNSGALIELCEAAPLSTMDRFQRLMVSHYHKQDVKPKVLEWSLLLAEGGKPNDLLYVAQTYLAMREPVSAISYLERAADRGSGAAYQLLGEIYKQGLGVEPSETKAIGYYEESARMGFILSKSRLLHAKRSQRGVWYLPIFAVEVLRLTLESKRLFAKDPNDPRLSFLPHSNGSQT